MRRFVDQLDLRTPPRRVRGLVFVAFALGVAGSAIVSAPEALPGTAMELPAVAAGAPAVSPEPVVEPRLRVASLAEVDPATAGLDPARLMDAVAAVRREAARGAFPGAVLVVGRGTDVVLTEGIGRTRWNGPAVVPQRTVYDIASLTKVVATTTAIMLLLEDGRIDLDEPVQKYVPEFSGGAKALVTFRHLLTHTSGLPDWIDVKGLSASAALRKIFTTDLEDQPGEDVEYSDLGFVILYLAAEAAAGEPVPRLLDRRAFKPLGMTSTRFRPGLYCFSCAPTLVEDDGSVRQGLVHDPIAEHLGGIAGNAGLFSTGPDLARFAAMLANGGTLGGVRVLREETIRQFTARQPAAGTRALGWDTPERDGTGSGGRRISPRAFGHTGFTGTSLWVDPDRGTWTILLTNRTYEPRAASPMQALRRAVNDRVATAAE